jgi:catechol 2,3-dioxygenase-like lactoylglutathione lyase family enzyme
MKPSGEVPLVRGRMMDGLMGLSKVSMSNRFLVDDRNLIQLELNRFRSPKPRPRPEGWRPCDIGISRLAIKVSNFENTFARLKGAGFNPLTSEMNVESTRRVCIHDPDNMLVEIIESNPGELPEATVSRIAGIALSIPDIGRARQSYVETLGIRETQTFPPYREALWGLDGAQRDIIALDAEGCWIEVAQYTDPKPNPRPDDYLKSDLGLVHIGFRCGDRGDYDRTLKRAVDGGFERSERVLHFHIFKIAYLRDHQDFTVELFYVPRWLDRAFGFRPPLPPLRLMNKVLRKLVG